MVAVLFHNRLGVSTRLVCTHVPSLHGSTQDREVVFAVLGVRALKGQVEIVAPAALVDRVSIGRLLPLQHMSTELVAVARQSQDIAVAEEFLYLYQRVSSNFLRRPLTLRRLLNGAANSGLRRSDRSLSESTATAAAMLNWFRPNTLRLTFCKLANLFRFYFFFRFKKKVLI